MHLHIRTRAHRGHHTGTRAKKRKMAPFNPLGVEAREREKSPAGLLRNLHTTFGVRYEVTSRAGQRSFNETVKNNGKTI